jgi:hypothetical protein
MGQEGDRGQHVVTLRSVDHGRTWSARADVEPADGPEASYAVLFKAPYGRVYCFYGYNGENRREVLAEDGKTAFKRTDSLGQYVFRFYDDRNPAWLMAGREIATAEGRRLAWSQPEIALYDDDPIVRFSYPDLVEEGGRFWLTETQKCTGRAHEVPAALMDGLFGQEAASGAPRDGLLLERVAGAGESLRGECEMPMLPHFTRRDHSRMEMPGVSTRAGFTVEIEGAFDRLAEGEIVLDARSMEGVGWCLRGTARGTLEVVLCDGRTVNTWDTDPGALRAGARQHVAVIVDGGPRVILFVVDGVLCDGGESRQFGWGRFSPNLQHVRGSARLRLAPGLAGRLSLVRLYDRALRVSETVACWRSTTEGR